jgi:primosomal protein N' (replication factor Y)
MTRRATPADTRLDREGLLAVALDAPMMRPFHYLPPAGGAVLNRGQRVRVPFRTGRRIGVVVGTAERSDVPRSKLRRVLEAVDPEPLLDDALMALLDWASGYYQHPPGEVYATAMPRLLRHGRDTAVGETVWQLTAAGREAQLGGKAPRAPVQTRVLAALAASAGPLTGPELEKISTGWNAAIRALEKKGWVARRRGSSTDAAESPGPAEVAPNLTAAQAAAVAEIESTHRYRTFLLEGVTGSGKTEVYFRCIRRQIASGRQSLVLVPEIGLTPQLVSRFRRRFPTANIVVLHSGLSDRQRLEAWLKARDGRAAVVIGTRSAVFSPLRRAGLIVVDEEHDTSFKQQEGFRYSARDIAVWRARQLDVPVILGSATPSLESLANVEAGRYHALRLPDRAGAARPPDIHLIDLRRHMATDGLTSPLLAAIRRHLDAGGQALLFLNRRGFAPTLLCPGCGQCLECDRCDARMVLHRGRARVICHHCGAERPAPDRCSECGGELFAVGQGTERLESALKELFPEAGIVRIDRDTTRGRGQMEHHLEQIASGQARILLGTQMLTKGHDFPGMTLVGIVDADQGLFGTDFRAAERLAQTIVQVAGRAGRADKPGEVYIQTLFPEHPLLTVLVREGYARFAAAALAERDASHWPPFGHLALLRAEAPKREATQRFLTQARTLGDALRSEAIELLGPAPAPMERRGGRYRAQLLVHATRRAGLQPFLAAWRERFAELPETRRVRWSLDVDPIELF